MFPLVTKGGGKSAGFPDVVKVPAPAPPGFVPTPCPNMASPGSASGTISQVQVAKADAFVISSKIPSSQGDEPGVQKGMVVPKHRDECKPIKPSVKVRAKGKSVIMCPSPTTNNGNNCPAAAFVQPSQTKVFAGS